MYCIFLVRVQVKDLRIVKTQSEKSPFVYYLIFICILFTLHTTFFMTPKLCFETHPPYSNFVEVGENILDPIQKLDLYRPIQLFCFHDPIEHSDTHTISNEIIQITHHTNYKLTYSVILPVIGQCHWINNISMFNPPRESVRFFYL